jgi:tetratricopeptide (TPR) repeat protein
VRVPLVQGYVDLEKQLVVKSGQATGLSPNETRLLRYLAERAGQTVEHDELLREVFGYADTVKSRTVITTMQRLRKKVEPDPGEPVHLQSVYGRGYLFEPLGETSALVGRASVLAQLRDALKSGPVWLVAPGGYGKSTLARHFAKLHADDPLWVDLTSSTTAEELLSAMANALAIGAVDDPDAIRRALAHRAPDLVVLDAAETLDAVLPPFVAAWGAVAPVLVTSRSPWDGPVLSLGPLDTEASLRLLSHCVPRTIPEAQLAPFAERIGGVPLAIELVCARLGQFTEDALRTQLDALGGLLMGGSGRQTSMEEVLAWSWERMPESLRRAATRLAPIRQGIALPDAVALLGSDGLAQLADLQRWGWVRAREGLDGAAADERIGMLDPIRQFIASRADLGPAQAAHRKHFLKRTRERAEDLWVGRARDFLDAEWGNLRAALKSGWSVPSEDSVELALLLVPAMGQRVPMSEALRWLDEAVRVAEGPLLGDVLVLRAALWMSRTSLDAAAADIEQASSLGVRDAGLLALRRGRLQQERLDLDASRESLEDAVRQLRGFWKLHARLALAYTLIKADRTDEAAGHLRAVLARARVENAPSLTLLALGNLGILHTRNDDFEAARAAHHEALAISEAAGLDLTSARVHTQLGGVELYRGDTKAAARHWREAVAISRRLGAQVGVAMGKVNLANLELVARRLDDARILLEDACQIFSEASFPPGLAYARLGLGRLAGLEERWDEAARWLQRCDDGLPPQLAWLVGVERCIGRALQGDAEGARAALEDGGAPTDAGSRAGWAVAEAFCALSAGHDDASDAVQKALSAAQAVNDPVIGDLAQRLRDFLRRPRSPRL